MAHASNGRNAAYRRLDLEAVQVTLILRTIQVSGTIHVEPHTDTRFSDCWESFRRLHDSRKFFPLTDVTIHDGGTPRTVSFIMIDRDEVVAAYPLRETG